MKQAIKFLAFVLVMATLAFIPPKHHITGRWMEHNPDGSKAYVDFNSTGTFNEYSKGKLIHKGNYKFNDPVISISGKKDGCGDGYWAKYKFTFYGNDSVSLSAIEDSCTPRRESVNGGGLRRLKKDK